MGKRAVIGGGSVMASVRSRRASAEALRHFWDDGEDSRGLAELSPQGVVTAWSSGCERLTGCALDEAAGKSLDTLLGLAGEPGETPQPFTRKDGTPAWACFRTAPLHRGGALLGYAVIMREAKRPRLIDEVECRTFGEAIADAYRDGATAARANALRESEARHVAIESALRESEERFQFALRGANDGIWDWNLRTNDVVFSSRWKSMLGYADHELPNNVGTWVSLLHPADRPGAEERVRKFLAGEIDRYEIEFRMAHKGGGYRTILARGHLVRDEHGEQWRLVGTHVDITERQQAELALRKSEEMLRRTQAIASVAGWTFDIAEGCLTTSRSGRCMMSWVSSERGPQRDDASVHADDVARVEAAWAAALTGAPYEIEYRITVNGELREVYARATTDLDGEGRPVTITGVAQDITARRKLEEQFRQAQKMDAVGQLAGGIAHDFNNLLTVINSAAEGLLEELTDGPIRDEIADIRTAGERASALTQQLLAFSRKQILRGELMDLNEVATRSERLFCRLIGEDVAVVTILTPKLWQIEADPGQIEQVLLNLVVNARDAMPTGGRLTIETRNRTIPNTSSDGVVAGQYVELSVADTGVGIPEELRDKIFEPFFTTKSVGKGTGLGLATVYGIVKQSGGHIEVTSTVGLGTKLKLLLPRARSQAAPREASLVAADARGTETILLVEDEGAVRRIARRALEKHGYAVLEASSGAEAVRVANATGSPIQLLITDVVMPGMSGRQVADALGQRDKNARVLFMSGYTDDAVVRNGVFEARDNFLAKPFTALSLIRKVRAVLDA